MSDSESFGVSVVDVGDVHVVRPTGELDLESADSFTQRLVDIPGSTVVVDLSGLSFMDSSGISALIKVKTQMEHDGDSLLICRPPPNVLRVMEVTGLADWVSEWSPEWSAESDLAT
jgi:anti-sigma B factor antagonist